jgi:uncharacterized protein YndB with AHSA1/START domain
MFTVNDMLQSWLVPLAAVEPVVGGRYELFWQPEERENFSTLGCRVTAVEPDSFISFEWKGPKQFKHFMNEANPLTHVTVFFIPSLDVENATEAHLIHSGWRSSPEWEEARQWFERVWGQAFEQLQMRVRSVVVDSHALV